MLSPALSPRQLTAMLVLHLATAAIILVVVLPAGAAMALAAAAVALLPAAAMLFLRLAARAERDAVQAVQERSFDRMKIGRS